jgi:hypothetical protein
MNIRAIDKEIRISGMWKSGIELSLNGVNSTDSYEPIIKRGGAYIPIFDNMDNFASKLNSNKKYKWYFITICQIHYICCCVLLFNILLSNLRPSVY